jgi:hypothetical protein
VSKMVSNDDVLFHFFNDAIDVRDFGLITLAYGNAKSSPMFYARRVGMCRCAEPAAVEKVVADWLRSNGYLKRRRRI